MAALSLQEEGMLCEQVKQYPVVLDKQEQGMLCEKVKQYPVVLDKQLKGYREKYVVTNTWNAVAKEIEIGRFLLFCTQK